MRREDEEEEEEPVSLEIMCRREGYEKLINQYTYCMDKLDEKCIYRSDTKDKIGYRCMMLEKQYF